MKRFLFVFVSMLAAFSLASADVEMTIEHVTPAPTPYIEGTSPGGYLWDVPIGTPFSQAQTTFESAIGQRIKYDGKNMYSSDGVIIKGFPFDFTFKEDESGCFRALTASCRIESDLSLLDVLKYKPLRFDQFNAIYSMLVQKFGNPVSSYWSFGPKYPLFDIPFSDGVIDFSSVVHASVTRNSYCNFVWDHLSIFFGIGSTRSGGSSLSCTINEKGSTANKVETLGEYSEESLVMNSGITSF